MLRITGETVILKPRGCAICGTQMLRFVKLHSEEDKKTVRICNSCYGHVQDNAGKWDIMIRECFPKYEKKRLKKLEAKSR